jgi:hypothetical protein
MRETTLKAMVFDKAPSTRPLPNLDKLRAFDVYYAKLKKETQSIK